MTSFICWLELLYLFCQSFQHGTRLMFIHMFCLFGKNQQYLYYKRKHYWSSKLLFISVILYQIEIFFSFGILHIGQLGSIAVTVSIATERFLTVCYPNSHFSRKYLLILLPILISIIYNIPKFFEIVRCSDNEMYLNMLKSYYKDNINNTIKRRASYVTF